MEYHYNVNSVSAIKNLIKPIEPQPNLLYIRHLESQISVRSAALGLFEFTTQTTAMATSQSPTDPNRIDRLTILSLLPIKFAVQTSILSRRFRFFWEALPSLDLICINNLEKFLVIADRVLLRRNRSYPLVSLRIDINYCPRNMVPPASFISSLLVKAHWLDIEHLTIVGFSRIDSVIYDIFSIRTLKSLSLDGFPYSIIFQSEITFTGLRSLYLKLFGNNPAMVDLLISELCSLEDLELDLNYMPKLTLSSQKIKKLKLILHAQRGNTVELFLPSVESLHLISERFYQILPRFHGEFPLLRKAVIALYEFHVKDVHRLLNCVSRVEELAMHIVGNVDEKIPMHLLSKPGPNFFNLKHFKVTVCFRGQKSESKP